MMAQNGEVKKALAMAQNISPRLGNAFVRIIGERLGKFVEFEFSLNDEDLAVELILPIKAFEEFCITQKAQIIKNEADNNNAEEILWRLKNPGLLQKVNKKQDLN